MKVESKGNIVTAKERLEDIADRFGKDSDDYKMAYKICEITVK